MQNDLNRKLLQDLVTLRLRIKNAQKQTGGKTVTVCSDEALMNICKYQPKRLEDLTAIAGIGRNFITNYGQDFLDMVLSHQPETERVVATNHDLTKTLKELEKRLVNINRRNRLLRLSKTSRSHSIDLFDVSTNVGLMELLLTKKKKSLRICDLRNSRDKDAESIKYRRLTYLIREANATLREKGQFDMYIGYPFVIGMLSNGDFPVRAPLALFPVKISKEPNHITVSIDSDKDILYNNTLVLAHNKFNNVIKPLPDNEIEEMDGEHFFEHIIKHYHNEKINLKFNEHNIMPFRDYMASEFPQFANGDLFLENCAVLGSFPVYASSLQRDFNSMIDQGSVNKLLVKLLDDYDQVDYLDEDVYTERVSSDGEISESDISYINDLNNSQEHVISKINNSTELVVQGPPGTGKSQTITSIIVDAVLRGQNVLMVSEKKAALDVIHSRLGDISDYSLLLDDTKNKSLFYKQIENIMDQHGANAASSTLEQLSDGIDESIESLDTIVDALYRDNDYGIQMYKLFRDSRRYDFAIKDEFRLYQLLRESIDAKMYEWKYPVIAANRAMFANKDIVDRLVGYMSTQRKYYYLKRIKEKLSDYEIADLGYSWDRLSGDIARYNSGSFFAKIFGKGKITKSTKEYIDRYFDKVDSSFVKKMMGTIAGGECPIDRDIYNQYYDNRSVYRGLSALESRYFRLILQLQKKLKNTISDVNEIIYNHIIYTHIEKFRYDYRDTIALVDDFDMVIRQILTMMDTKMSQTRQQAQSMLFQQLNDNILKSKRHNEMKRQIQSRRKISVHKYIEKFSFELFKGIKIWLLTPEVVSEILPLECGMFDLAIFDEASQMFIEKGIPAIFRAKKVIIAGDHKQLRPSNLGSGRIQYDDDTLINEETTAAIEEESLLDLARFKFDEVMLNYHYRSRYEELIAFSNYAFYKGNLYVTPNVDTPDMPPIEVVRIDNGMWRDRANMEEAKQVVFELKRFFETRQNNETVGIITFNRNQRDMIMDIIDEQSRNDDDFRKSILEETGRVHNGEDIGLFIKNIENVQGDERDVIIFSIGYAKNEAGKLVRNFGWLNQRAGENRLNVAISRAKQKIKIVTSIYPSELRVDDLKNDGPKLLKKYLEFCFAVSGQQRDEAQQILLSMHDRVSSDSIVEHDTDFAQQVCDRLTEQGLTVQRQVGIGGYRIDLAIFDTATSEYVLGIECDGKLYTNGSSTRERDIHRQKYLESRGWRIYRIFSTDWWSDMDAEIARIVDLAGEHMSTDDAS